MKFITVVLTLFMAMAIAMNKVKTTVMNFIKLELPKNSDTVQHRIPT